MSTALAPQVRRYTPDDLLAMPDGKSYELVDGRLVERNMGAESSRIATQLCSHLDRFCSENGLGLVWGPDNGYQCFPHAPGRVRKPDVSFVRRGRLPGDVVPAGWITIPPDLAVEVISPGDKAEELEDKLRDYRRAGIPLVWVIYPKTRQAKVFRPGRPSAEIEEDEDLLGEDVIPGFRCRLSEILPRVEASQTPPAGGTETGTPEPR